MKWIASHDYVGIPYLSHGRTRSGVDCWGLTRLVYLEQLGIDLPTYAGAYTDAAERSEVKAAIENGRSLWTQTETPEPGDVVLLKITRDPTHVGIYVGDGFMLHVRRGANTCLERLNAPFWRTRVVGYYRYAG